MKYGTKAELLTSRL